MGSIIGHRIDCHWGRGTYPAKIDPSAPPGGGTCASSVDLALCMQQARAPTHEVHSHDKVLEVNMLKCFLHLFISKGKVAPDFLILASHFRGRVSIPKRTGTQ